jgi:DNA-directed RNA polymerase subunit beta'
MMVMSGGRGNAKQLAQVNVAPIVAKRHGNPLVNNILDKSYSEGLPLDQFFLAFNQSRMNQAGGKTAVAKAGELTKIMSHLTMDYVITIDDCKTKSGKLYDITKTTSDVVFNDIYGRHLVDSGVNQPLLGKLKNNTLLDEDALRLLKRNPQRILVRTPIYCSANDGLCAKCFGQMSNGKALNLGENIGVIASTSISEPLTQFSMNAKHGNRSGVEASALAGFPGGLEGARQAVLVPKSSFIGEGVMCNNTGTVNNIQVAPQGGWYVYVDRQKYYVAPTLKVSVKIGQKLVPGDAISSGVLHPMKVVSAHGLTLGREHYADILHYATSGGNLNSIDRRLAEVISIGAIKYVKILKSDSNNTFLRGDIVPFNKVRNYIQNRTKAYDLNNPKQSVLAMNKILAQDTPFFKFGEKLTAQVLRKLYNEKIGKVLVVDDIIDFEFYFDSPKMRASNQDNWVAGMAGTYLRNTIRDAVLYGKKSEVTGYNPMTAIITGTIVENKDSIKY